MCGTQYKDIPWPEGVHMSQKEEIVSGLTMELRRGTIVLCVLSQLKEPTYGYSLVNVLSENGIPMETNTLYPLLRRLEKQGLLQSSWETSGAKPRKYYVITDFGREVYDELKEQWQKSMMHMTRMLGD